MVVSLLPLNSPAAGQSSQKSAYLRLETAFESNIYEQHRAAEAGLSGQGWFGFTHQRTRPKSYRKLQLTANLTGYRRYSSQHRVSNQLISVYRRALGSKRFYFAIADLYAKQWLFTEQGYLSVRWYPSLGFRKNNTTILIGPILKTFCFKPSHDFDAYELGVRLKPIHALGPDLNLYYQFCQSGKHYGHRRVYSESDPDSADNVLQKDRQIALQIGFEYRPDIIIGGDIQYLMLSSNSDYLSHKALMLNFYSTQKIGHLILHLIAQIQLKDYQKAGKIIFKPDPEQDIQNRIFLGWERALSEHFALTGKMAYIKSETRYSGQYYWKWFLSAGLTLNL